MKRCPLCDFIYEDEQGVCDMDGIELVHERGAIVPTGQDTTYNSLTPARSPRRRRTHQLLLGFGLGAAVFSAYYTSVNQAAPASVGKTTASYAARPSKAAVEPTPAPIASEPATPPSETPVASVEKAKPTPAPVSPAAKPRAVSPSAKRPRPGGESKKKESKLTSILNKTGRILKKPFKF